MRYKRREKCDVLLFVTTYLLSVLMEFIHAGKQTNNLNFT